MTATSLVEIGKEKRVVSPDLPPAFAHSAGYGDIIAAILAVLALISLPSGAGVVVAWISSRWGSADIVNAFYQANRAVGLSSSLWVVHKFEPGHDIRSFFG
jgi:hypothetical protein